MITIKVPVALERKLRELATQEEIDSPVAKELVDLMDLAYKTKAQIKEKRMDEEALGYANILGLFRLHLGSRLVVPVRPNPIWIRVQVQRAQEIRIDNELAKQLSDGVRYIYPNRRTYSLEFILSRPAEILAEYESRKAEEQYTPAGEVVTGRTG